jgi:hypothetical protein
VVKEENRMDMDANLDVVNTRMKKIINVDDDDVDPFDILNEMNTINVTLFI